MMTASETVIADSHAREEPQHANLDVLLISLAVGEHHHTIDVAELGIRMFGCS